MCACGTFKGKRTSKEHLTQTIHQFKHERLAIICRLRAACKQCGVSDPTRTGDCSRRQHMNTSNTNTMSTGGCVASCTERTTNVRRIYAADDIFWQWIAPTTSILLYLHNEYCVCNVIREFFFYRNWYSRPILKVSPKCTRVTCSFPTDISAFILIKLYGAE